MFHYRTGTNCQKRREHKGKVSAYTMKSPLLAVYLEKILALLDGHPRLPQVELFQESHLEPKPKNYLQDRKNLVIDSLNF